MEFDYAKNLINENEKLRNLDPLRKLMQYRNDNMRDRDRCLLAMNVYHKLGWLYNEKRQEPDTFFASPYYHLRLMCKKFDKENNKNFYVYKCQARNVTF